MRMTARTLLFFALLAAAATAGAGDWPETADRPVEPLDHVTLEQRLSAGDVDPDAGYSFVVFGDQRAQADEGWQGLIAGIADLPPAEQPLFIIDTGDIVKAGKYSDQFCHLRDDILSPVRHIPYLVGVGNHELEHNRGRIGLENSARFLSYLDPAISPDRFWYQKIVGPVRYIFLNSADFAVGDDGLQEDLLQPQPGSRAQAQMAWLDERLRETGDWKTTVVISHYPFLQTSKSHRGEARAQWLYAYRGRRLVDRLVDGGVDMVLCGHTHTYERFTLTRADGRGLALVNVSGKPHGLVWPFKGAMRRAKDIRGRESDKLDSYGFRALDGWTIVQEDVMLKADDANQFVRFVVDADGGITGRVHYLDDDAPGGWRLGAGFTIPISDRIDYQTLD